jgi:hypothetical protein
MKAEMSGEPEKLVGKYFHSANETNKIEWQGLVMGSRSPAGIWCNFSNGLQGTQARYYWIYVDVGAAAAAFAGEY